MKILANKEIKNLFHSLSLVFGVTFLLSEVFLWLSYRRLSLLLLILFLLAGGAVWAVCFVYFNRQNQIMEQAILQINAYLDGDRNARIECDNEGELYRLFHSINSLAAVLNAHADNELREKEFLKNTISDISHQLKTPLAALNIYNGLLQDEDIEVSSVKEFAGLSEQELDRIETLVQSLLKITRLDPCGFGSCSDNGRSTHRQTSCGCFHRCCKLVCVHCPGVGKGNIVQGIIRQSIVHRAGNTHCR